MGQAVHLPKVRLLAAAGVALLLAMLALAASAPPAAAHDVCTSHPSDPDALGSGALNTVVCMRYNHTRLDVCDRHVDGHKAYARRYVWGGYLEPLYDTNGAESGCGNYPVNSLDLLSFNVCVQYEGCGTPESRPY